MSLSVDPPPPRQSQALRSLSAARSIGDPHRIRQAEQEVVLAHLTVAAAIARRYRSRGVALDDLQQVGRLSLVVSVSRWNPAIRQDFIPFAVVSITGAIKRHFRDHLHPLRLPRRFQEINTAADQMSQEVARATNRSPDTISVAAALGVVVSELQAARAARFAVRTVEIGVAGSDPSFEDFGFHSVEMQADLKSAMGQLSHREQTIVWMYFGYEWTQSRIGREIGISQMHVSRLLRAALVKLGRHMTPF